MSLLREIVNKLLYKESDTTNMPKLVSEESAAEK